MDQFPANMSHDNKQTDVVKRKRGRPKKLQVIAPVASRHTSPLSEHMDQFTANMLHDNLPAEEVKRKRGRPKKLQITAPVLPSPISSVLENMDQFHANLSHDNEHADEVKRKPGRPKKLQITVPVSPSPPTPRKTASPLTPKVKKDVLPKVMMRGEWEQPSKTYARNFPTPRSTSLRFQHKLSGQTLEDFGQPDQSKKLNVEQTLEENELEEGFNFIDAVEENFNFNSEKEFPDSECVNAIDKLFPNLSIEMAENEKETSNVWKTGES